MDLIAKAMDLLVTTRFTVVTVVLQKMEATVMAVNPETEERTV